MSAEDNKGQQNVLTEYLNEHKRTVMASFSPQATTIPDAPWDTRWTRESRAAILHVLQRLPRLSYHYQRYHRRWR